MKGKKFIAAVCTFVMVSGIVFTGCGSKDAKTSATSAPTSTAEAVSEKASTALSLKVEIFDRGNAPKGFTAEDNTVTQWIKKEVKDKTNVDVTFVPVPRSQEYDKLNMMMASNTAPDIVFTNNAMVPKSFAQNGGLTDLGPLMDKYGKTLKTFIGDDQLKLGTFYNKLYCIPGKQTPQAIHVTMIRKDWVEKLGAKLPKTKAEFYTLLKRFKDEDPGGVGKDKVIPYAMGAANSEKNYENFVMSFVKKDAKEEAVYSGILKAIRPGTKDGFKELSKWYTEGLISKDFALDTSEKQFAQDITTGRVGAFTADNSQFNGWFDAFKKNVPNGEFWPIDAFENTQGEYYKEMGAGMGLKIMVPKASEKNGEAAMRYLNWMADKNNILNLKYGLEGVSYKLDAQGLPEVNTTTDERLAKGVMDTLQTDVGIIASDIDFGTKEKNVAVMLKSVPKGMEKIATESYDVSRSKGTYKQYFFQVPFDSENKYGTSIQSMLRGLAPKLVISGADFDKVYDAEMKKVMDAGAKQLIDDRSKAYDEKK